MIPLAVLAVAAACWPIDAPKDQITAADLARALPEWRAAAVDSVIGIAPAPGVIRVLHIVELRRLAARFGVASEPAADVCFQRPVAAVPPDRILGEMKRRLPGARIDIIETSRMPAPSGQLEFPLSGLRPGYWYGYISYGVGHKFVVWARVDVKVSVKCVVASADLKAGQPIDPAQLQLQVRDEFPSAKVRDADVGEIEAMAGRSPPHDSGRDDGTEGMAGSAQVGSAGRCREGRGR